MPLLPKLPIYLLSGALIFSVTSAYASECSRAVNFYGVDSSSLESESLSVTLRLVGYLDDLISRGQLNLTDLTNMLESLESFQGQKQSLSFTGFQDPLSFGVHTPLLTELLSDVALEKETVREWLKGTISTIEQVGVQRDHVSDETHSLVLKREDIPVRRGKVWSTVHTKEHPSTQFQAVKDARADELAGMSVKAIEKRHRREKNRLRNLDSYQIRQFEILQDFTLTSTPITQVQWLEVMGDLPTGIFSGGDSLIALPFEGTKEHDLFQLDGINLAVSNGKYSVNHPVFAVSVWSIFEFANRLSIKEGLAPVYDLSRIEFKGRAENGTLVPSKDQKLDLRILGRGRDIYLTEGYRLPTRFEIELALRQNFTEYTTYFFGEDESLYDRYAWGRDDSTQPVALKEPFRTEFGDFYDFHGNIAQLVFAWKRQKLKGMNPGGRVDKSFWEPNPSELSTQVDLHLKTFGGTSNFNNRTAIGLYRSFFSSSTKALVGFRLARSLKDGELENMTSKGKGQ